MGCMGEIERLDATLASVAQEEGALRLRLGQLLEIMGRGAVFELGFSSLGAYAVERCERSVRWAEGVRCLARRLEAVPQLRQAVAMGKVSWSMAEALAPVIDSDDVAHWLELAESRTVRQVRALVASAKNAKRAAANKAAAQALMTTRTSRAPGSAESGTAALTGHRDLHVDTSTPRHSSQEGALSGAPAKHTADNEHATAGGDMNAAREGAASGSETCATALEDHETTAGVDVALGDRDSVGSMQGGGADATCTLTCTVDREEAWLFEATRCLLDQLGEHTAAAQSEALLAEAHGTLLALLPKAALDELDCTPGRHLAQHRWMDQLRRWREEAEAACEKTISSVLLSAGSNAAKPTEQRVSVALEASLGMASLLHTSCTALDQQVRALAATLARHELELSRLVLRFQRADGWRRLGYATEAQYARERMGLSHSSLCARRKLALRLEKLPGVTAALGASQIGVEAALQIVRIATAKTETAWVERARRRTIKYLREEVAAALTAVRLSGESDCLPPEDSEIAAFQTLERAVVSGRLVPREVPPIRSSPLGPARRASARPGASGLPSSGLGAPPESASQARRAWWVMLGSLASWLEGGLQTSAARPGAAAGRSRSCGRVTLRLRMSRETYAWWRGLEAQARRWLPEGMSWLRFLCSCVWHAWGHLLGTDAAYGEIYVRDRFRCTTPVCNRRDVTPHHLRYRSAGGSDEAHNITSGCTWCHLYGVHGGRIRATGTAERIHWELGPRSSPCVIVHGRDRLAA